MEGIVTFLILVAVVSIILFSIFVFEKYALSKKRSKKNFARQLVMVINKLKLYTCSCESKSKDFIYIGFVWSKYTNIFAYGIFFVGLAWTALFAGQSEDDALVTFLVLYVVFAVLLVVELYYFLQRRKAVLSIGHTKKCATKCALVSSLYDIPKVETFIISDRKIDGTML